MCEQEKLGREMCIFGENENVSLGTIFLLSFKSDGKSGCKVTRDKLLPSINTEWLDT